jgi:pilus assembly protein CpaB
LILIGAVAAAVSAALAYFLQLTLSPATDGKALRGAPATCLVAARDVPMGHRLTESDLDQVDIVSRPAGETLVSSRALVVGRTTSVALVKGQALRTGDLVDAGSGASIAGQLSAGMRAITVSLRDTGPEVVLYPGALVDMLATLERPGRAAEQRDTVTVTLLEGVRVLAVNDEAVGVKAAAETPVDRRGAARKLTVTLAVTPEQAAQVELASTRGTVGISLRPEGDRSGIAGSPASATARSILGLPEPSPGTAQVVSAPVQEPVSGAPLPATPTPPVAPRGPIWQVTVMRGDSTTTHEFPASGAANPRGTSQP